MTYRLIVILILFSARSLAQSYSPLILESNLNRGDTTAAITYLEEVVSAGSEAWQAHYNLAVLKFNTELKIESLPNFRKAVDLNPALWETTYYLGHIYYAMDSVQQAVQNYTEYLMHKPENKEIRHYRAESYMKQNDYFNAVSDWTILYKSTQDLYVLYNRGLALMGLNDQEGARADLRAVIAEDEGMVSARYYMGLSYKRSYDLKQAVSWWSDLLDRWPHHMPSLYQMANYYHEKGRKRKACIYFNRALAEGYEPIGSDSELSNTCN